MKTELHFKCYMKTEMTKNFRTAIADYIHTNIRNMSNIRQKYSDNG